MLEVTINGKPHEFPAGLTILAALREIGIEVPTVCHDDRLEAFGRVSALLGGDRGLEPLRDRVQHAAGKRHVDPNSFARG